ncbi:MAG: alpha/beta fold hydrolase [Actinobacteria bacterium]|nr:alpha/beta fold hydrolase [Actinomycetota bacterium]
MRSAALLVLLGACAAAPGVTASNRAAMPPTFERGVELTTVDSLPEIEPIRWGTCPSRPLPWECATITVPLDYRHPDDADAVAIAVTRLPAAETSDRIGALVLNPGGPGASGIDLAWSYASVFPSALTDAFDLVGFDPRGVGRSSAVDCGDLDRSFSVIEHDCIVNSGRMLPYLGTVNAARDMEQLRKALGDEQLTYLGFSYGTALGAVYADLFPESVRALVLDGSIDPAAGQFNIDGTSVGSFEDPFYGVQDFGGTLAVFLELCDATRLCAAGPRTEDLLGELEAGVADADTDYFDGWDDVVTGDQVAGIVASAMYNTDLWAPLAIALADAAQGDASALAALGSFLEAGYPQTEDTNDNLVEAHLAVYCADFAGRSGRFAVESCSGWPESAEPLPPVTAVDVANPILVIGTDGDPATPGFLAPRMAEALQDAVSVRWEGAGHTAFLHSECVDRIVIDYLVDLQVPPTRTHCGFTDDVNTTVARATEVFSLDRSRFRIRLQDVIEAEGSAPDVASCLAAGIIDQGSDSVVIYARLGVQHPEYVALRQRLSCTGVSP